MFFNVGMSTKKKKIVDENRIYSEEWVDKYVFIIQNTNFMYLIFWKTVAVFKWYNVKRHYGKKIIILNSINCFVLLFVLILFIIMFYYDF